MSRRKRKPTRPTKEEVKAVMDDVEVHNLPDGAHWAMIHQRLGLEYGEVFPTSPPTRRSSTPQSGSDHP